MLHALAYFFFNDTATTEVYTLSLHDALPISPRRAEHRVRRRDARRTARGLRIRGRVVARGRAGHVADARPPRPAPRSEEHTSELQSRQYLVCRLLLEKKRPERRTTSRTG